MKTILINECHKYEINGDEVQFFEKMGERWVPLGNAEKWSDELIADLENMED